MAEALDLQGMHEGIAETQAACRFAKTNNSNATYDNVLSNTEKVITKKSLSAPS